MTTRVDHAVVAGDHNVWVVGDDLECAVIDVPDDLDAILNLVAGRKVRAILCTHASDDHARVAPALRAAVHAPILLHPDERPHWESTHTDELWDVDLSDGQLIEVGGTTLQILHTPGHSPGAVCFLAADLGCVFTGDTPIGPGTATTILSLPGAVVVHAGHGADTTLLEEKSLDG